MSIKVTVTGALELQFDLARYARQVGNTGPLVLAVLTQVDQFKGQQFRSRGAATGGWAPLKPATVKAKLRRGGDAGPLIGAGAFGGQLRDNWELLHSATGGSFLSHSRLGPYHQWGTSRGLPARPMVPDEDAVSDMADRAVSFFLERALT